MGLRGLLSTLLWFQCCGKTQRRQQTCRVVFTVVDWQPGSVETATIQRPLVGECCWVSAAGVDTAREQRQPVCWIDLESAGHRSAQQCVETPARRPKQHTRSTWHETAVELVDDTYTTVDESWQFITSRELNVYMNGQRLKHDTYPVYLDVNLDLTLSCREHLSPVSTHSRSEQPERETCWYFMVCQRRHPPNISLGSMLLRRSVG